MTGEVESFEALEAQAQTLVRVLMAAGYEMVAPSVIQPADAFLDVIGEALRARMYVFTDPDGAELCLRPDITVPVARLHLARLAEKRTGANGVARYCYNGPAFRYQPTGGSTTHPREFRQAGLELIGAPDPEKADAEVLALTLDALAAAGLKGTSVRVGDIAIVEALLERLPIPERWRRRLMDRFWRPEAFRAELARLSTEPGGEARRLDPKIRRLINPADHQATEQALATYAQDQGFELAGVRTFHDVAARLIEVVEDAGLPPLAPAISRTIGEVLALDVPVATLTERVARIAKPQALDLSAVLHAAEVRLDHMRAAGLDTGRMIFEADFGRTIEYYSGFVFEVHGPALKATSPVAGGGRYDRLMRGLGADHDIPAVGCAMHTERVLVSIESIKRGVAQ